MVGIIIEIAALLLGIIALYVIYKITKSLVHLVINSVVALALLFGLNLLGVGIQINIWSMLTVVIGGLLGLIIVVALHLLRIAF